MGRDVLSLDEIDLRLAPLTGGKAAALGELSGTEGIEVPAGFCVTTNAFRRVLAATPAMDDLRERLSGVGVDERGAIEELGAEIRAGLEGAAIPDDLAEEIDRALSALGGQESWAVRSSATAEDLPNASFAGLQDSFLNVVGREEILRHIRRCWASLFTERAIVYRLQTGIGGREPAMAVIVQWMLNPRAAGVLFTADPVTSSRRISTVEAVPGLGEHLVSGLVSPDIYRVRGQEVLEKTPGRRRSALRPSPGGGTEQVEMDAEEREEPVLDEAQILRLAQLGRRIETRLGAPQDIEWCLTDEGFQVVQSRPVTTLYPIPDGDGENHVYVSVGHQQMMTDAMKPLGISLWQMTALPPMHEAGGRLFVDVTDRLASPATRAGLLEAMGRSDPLVREALETILDRGDFIPIRTDESPAVVPIRAPVVAIDADPAIVEDLVRRGEASVAALKDAIGKTSGPAVFEFILSDIEELGRLLFDPESFQVFMAAIEATWWLNEHLLQWLGERNAADALTQSVPNNITSEMGLALLDVADAIRPHPEVVAFLTQVGDDSFLDELPALAGGGEARAAIQAYLDRYGMRCVGEIDITKARWSEHPAALVPMLLANVGNFEPGAGVRLFEEGLEDAHRKEREILGRLEALPDGVAKAEETKRMIDRVRTFIGYREYPKYGLVSRYFLYKQAILSEAQRLVGQGVLTEEEDIFYLSFQELHELVRSGQADGELIRRRREAFRAHEALMPPRVLTSDGEVISGTFPRGNLPADALVGLPVSAGTIEGRARVILNMDQADLKVGDILVTTFTDPSWTPLFVAIAGLVTEVGGLMTHGAVIAREYGLPAVVGVENATRLIQDGQQIRVNGTDGYIEVI